MATLSEEYAVVVVLRPSVTLVRFALALALQPYFPGAVQPSIHVLDAGSLSATYIRGEGTALSTHYSKAREPAVAEPKL